MKSKRRPWRNGFALFVIALVALLTPTPDRTGPIRESEPHIPDSLLPPYLFSFHPYYPLGEKSNPWNERIGAPRPGSMARLVAEAEERLASVDWTADLDPDTVRLGYYMLSLQIRLGRFDDPATIELAEKTLSSVERAGAERDVAMGPLVERVSLIRQERGEYAEAGKLIEAMIECADCEQRDRARARDRLLRRLAAVRVEQGDFREARRVLDRLLRDRRDSSGEAGFLATAGMVTAAYGDFDLARTFFREASDVLAFRKNTRAIHDTVRVNHAIALASVGELEEAEKLLRQAVRRNERIYEKFHPRLSIPRYNLAIVLARRGKFAEARELFRLVVRDQTYCLGVDHPKTVLSRIAYANFLMIEESYDEAREIYDQVLAAMGRGAWSAPAHEPFVLASAARFAWTRGEAESAIELALRAERSARDHMASTMSTLSEREALRYDAIRTRGLDLALTVLTRGDLGRSRGFAERVWGEVISSRAMIFDEIARRARLPDHASSSKAARLYEVRSELSTLTHRLLETENPYALWDEWTRMHDRKETLERELAVELANRQAPESRAPMTLDRIRRALPEERALVGYFSYSDMGSPAERSNERLAWIAFVSRSDRPVAWFDLGPGELLRQAVRDWRESAAEDPRRSVLGVDGAERIYRRRAARLYRRIWRPLAESVAGAGHVLIVPDGELHLVNFSTLVDGSDGYVVDRGPTMSYLSAERELLQTEERPVGRGALFLGAPDHDSSASDVESSAELPKVAILRGVTPPTMRGRAFAPLPGARAELEDLSRAWTEANPGEKLRKLVGPSATEREVKRLAPGRRVVHLATHGFFVGAERLDPGGTPNLFPRLEQNPMLLSGLALAGANREIGESTAGADEDGLLTAEEIASIDLRSVERVVLSACSSGLGQVHDGEGVFGLRRAFRIAGARSLVLSLWPIRDDAARVFMESLYHPKRAEEPVAQAVRSASLEVLSRRRAAGESSHPFYWGAFVATGEP